MFGAAQGTLGQGAAILIFPEDDLEAFVPDPVLDGTAR